MITFFFREQAKKKSVLICKYSKNVFCFFLSTVFALKSTLPRKLSFIRQGTSPALQDTT